MVTGTMQMVKCIMIITCVVVTMTNYMYLAIHIFMIASVNCYVMYMYTDVKMHLQTVLCNGTEMRQMMVPRY